MDGWEIPHSSHYDLDRSFLMDGTQPLIMTLQSVVLRQLLTLMWSGIDNVLQSL